MNEVKSTERPTFAEASTVQVVAEAASVSPTGRESEGANAHNAESSGRHTVVAVRLSSVELVALDAVCKQLDVSRSGALRDSVRHVAEAFESGSVDKIENTLAKAVAAKRPRVVVIDEDSLAELREAMRETSERYAQQALQLQRIGNNWNQIARVANAGGNVDTNAVSAVERALARLGDVMGSDAERDSDIAMKLLKAL